jgi:hypothetical protein
VGLPSREKYRIPRLHFNVVQHECTEDADVIGELAMKDQYEVPYFLLHFRDTAVFVALNENIQLRLESLFVCGHNRRK